MKDVFIGGPTDEELVATQRQVFTGPGYRPEMARDIDILLHYMRERFPDFKNNVSQRLFEIDQIIESSSAHTGELLKRLPNLLNDAIYGATPFEIEKYHWPHLVRLFNATGDLEKVEKHISEVENRVYGGRDTDPSEVRSFKSGPYYFDNERGPDLLIEIRGPHRFEMVDGKFLITGIPKLDTSREKGTFDEAFASSQRAQAQPALVSSEIATPKKGKAKVKA